MNNTPIKHYASEYYDPAKAHEYYLKTRQLKGRTTGGMSDAQKEAWGYTKQKITEEKNAKIEALRQKAQEARDQIYSKLSGFVKANQSRAEREKIAKELKDSLESLRTEYEQIYNREYDNIKSSIKGKTPKKAKAKGNKEAKVDWETFDKT